MRVLFVYAKDIFVAKRALKNIPFYLLLTALIAMIHILHVSLHFHHDTALCARLIGCGLCEAIIEGFLFCYLASFFEKNRLLKSMIIIIAAFFPVIHLIDFILERLFNLSFWHTVYSFFSESFANMLELLYATNLPLWMWGLGFLSLILIGCLFLFIYQKIEKTFQGDKTSINLKSYGLFVLSLMGLYLPLKTNTALESTLNFHKAKVLPFKGLLFGQSATSDKIKITKKQTHQAPLEFVSGDNIFLFIVESLRDDAINQDTAPYLSTLGSEHFRHPFCLAGANGTHLSWYSLFFSQPALAWKTTKQKGAPLFKNLKDQGYDISVLSSARMSYYDMDKQLFGENNKFIDDYYCPKMQKALTAFEADKLCFDYLKTKISAHSTKKAFVIFLDATHFGYSLPEDAELKFSPHSQSIPYISSVFAKLGLIGIKNRYYNTILALDKLFKDLTNDLKNKGVFEESLFMVTADHGEEFYEKGQLFHASHLSNEQLLIPFIVKTPSSYPYKLDTSGTLSHTCMADLLYAVMSHKPYKNRSWQMASRFNFSLCPEETVLISKEGKALYHFDETSQILKLKGLFDAQDKPTSLKPDFPRNIELKDL